MSGSWEIKEANKVMVGILHTDITSVAWSFGIRNLKLPGLDKHRMFNPFMPLAGMPYDMARNVACMNILGMGVEWIFFLDSDVVPPNDAILRLMAHRRPFISGVYHRRSPPEGVPVMIKAGQGWVTNYPENTLFEVDLVGAGCLLIHRSLLESLPPQRPEAGKHWFDWRVDCKGLLPEGECLSEDFTLCTWAKRHGYRVIVDTSIQCRHIGLGEARRGSFKPAECHPGT